MAILALGLLFGLVSSSAANFTRVNPSECVVDGETIDLTEIAARLESTDCSANQTCSAKVSVAEDFEIEYFPTHKVVVNKNSAPNSVYVLYPCGTEQPAESEFQGMIDEGLDVGFYEIPLTSVAVSDSTASWLMEALDLQDRARYSDAYTAAPCLAKVAADEPDGCARVVGFEGAPVDDIDGEFTFSANSTKKQIALSASADPGPLNRAEHILFLAAFFNKEDAAFALYNDIVASYDGLKTTAGDDAPSVLWISYSDNLYDSIADANGTSVTGEYYAVSFAPYKVEISAAAGAKNAVAQTWRQAETSNTVLKFASSDNEETDVYFAPSAYASKDAMLAIMQPLLKEVDIVIDETYFADSANATLEKFLATWNISEAAQADYPFLASKQLYRNDKDLTRLTSGGFENTNSDWFGEAVVRPDLVLKDMRFMVDPTSEPNHEAVFFRNLAEGEASTFIGPETCSNLTCTDWENQAPLPIAEAIEGADVDGSEGLLGMGVAIALATFVAAVAL